MRKGKIIGFHQSDQNFQGSKKSLKTGKVSKQKFFDP